MKTYNIIGIDEFKKNIGIAICDENKLVATPLESLEKKKFESLSRKIDTIIKKNQIKGIVIGKPINMDGSIGKSAQSSMDFAKNLSTNITIPIMLWDERLSSVGALNLTKNLNTNISNKIKNLDKHAAAFILQGAIDYLSCR